MSRATLPTNNFLRDVRRKRYNLRDINYCERWYEIIMYVNALCITEIWLESGILAVIYLRELADYRERKKKNRQKHTKVTITMDDRSRIAGWRPRRLKRSGGSSTPLSPCVVAIVETRRDCHRHMSANGQLAFDINGTRATDKQ